MERNLVRPSACCTWRTWFLVCDHRGCWAQHLCYRGMFLDYWFFQCFALLQVPWKTIVFFSCGESMSAARLGSSKGLGRQVGQMLSGAVGMHVLYNWSLDNSWQLMPVLSYVLTSLQIQSRMPCQTRDLILLNLNHELGKELTVDETERLNANMPFPVSTFYRPLLPKVVLLASYGVSLRNRSKSSKFYSGRIFLPHLVPFLSFFLSRTTSLKPLKKNLDKQPSVLLCQLTDGLVTGTLA